MIFDLYHFYMFSRFFNVSIIRSMSDYCFHFLPSVGSHYPMTYLSIGHFMNVGPKVEGVNVYLSIEMCSDCGASGRISARLGGTMASEAKIVWPIPDLINELQTD